MKTPLPDLETRVPISGLAMASEKVTAVNSQNNANDVDDIGPSSWLLVIYV